MLQTARRCCCCTAKASPAIIGRAVAETLSAKGYRVIIPDQLGFGKSAKPDIRYSFDLLASNTKKLLDTLGLDRVAVVGHSFGGMLAVYFARDYPQTTAVLALENPIGLEDYRSAIPPQPLETLVATEMAQTPDTYRNFMKAFFTGWTPENERMVTIFSRLLESPEYPRLARANALTYEMIFNQPIRHEYESVENAGPACHRPKRSQCVLQALRLTRSDQAARQLAGARPRRREGIA